MSSGTGKKSKQSSRAFEGNANIFKNGHTLGMKKPAIAEYLKINKSSLTDNLLEMPVGTTELHYSTKKRKHSFSLLKAFFVRHWSEYETLDNDRKVNRDI